MPDVAAWPFPAEERERGASERRDGRRRLGHGSPRAPLSARRVGLAANVTRRRARAPERLRPREIAPVIMPVPVRAPHSELAVVIHVEPRRAHVSVDVALRKHASGDFDFRDAPRVWLVEPQARGQPREIWVAPTTIASDPCFTGKEEDVEVGLTYFGKRFYSPLLGRWLSPDPLEVHAPGEADGNLYAYVSGAVLKNIDPMGLQSHPTDTPPPTATSQITTMTQGQSYQTTPARSVAQTAPEGAAGGQATSGFDPVADLQTKGAITLGSSGSGSTQSTALDRATAMAGKLQGAGADPNGVSGGIPGGRGTGEGSPAAQAGYVGLTGKALLDLGRLAVAAGRAAVGAAVSAGRSLSRAIASARGTIPRLSDDIAKTFADGKYHSRVLQQDVVAYRYSGGVSGEKGRFLTTEQTVRQIGSPEAAQRALNLPAGATAEQLNRLVIPKGTSIYYGRVAGGGEKATQIFIHDASVLRAAP
jgi:RHS repeat-associated protein